MSPRQRGFGLLEATLALAIGLVLLAAAGQALVSTHQSWQLQGAAARMQEDARLALQRMAQDIRMTGVFGCLTPRIIDFPNAAAAQAFATPLRITRTADGQLASLSLLAGELSGAAGTADWTVLTDCRTWAKVLAEAPPGNTEGLAFPLRQQHYRVHDASLMLSSGGLNARLIDNVRGLWITQVQGQQGQRLDLRLQLFEPTLQLEQQYELSVTLRNRLPAP